MKGGAFYMGNCESCGMTLDDNSKSKFDKRYCNYCQDQETRMLKSFEEVKEGSIEVAMEYMRLSREDSQHLVEDNLSKLPRWKS